MVRSRALVLGLVAFALFAVEANVARADVSVPGEFVWPWSKRPPRPSPRIAPPDPNDPTLDPQTGPAPQPQPTPQQGAVDPNGRPYPPPRKPDPPKRTGLFHSCGSGAGTGLVGIALAWGALWLGNRFVGRVSRGAKK